MLPSYNTRKRWVKKLSEEVFNTLSDTDRENLLTFQNYSKRRTQKEVKIQKLKDDITTLKKEVIELNEKEEFSYLKIQFLHHVFSNRIDVTRQKRTPKSLLNTTGNFSLPRKKTHKGTPLKESYSWNGKVYSSSLDGSKSLYFQSEEKIKVTIGGLLNIDPTDVKVSTIKKFLKDNYSEYVKILMIEKGVIDFSKMSIRFDDFVKWYKNKQ